MTMIALIVMTRQPTKFKNVIKLRETVANIREKGRDQG